MIHLQRNVVCFGGARRLDRIEIENFKAIRRLVLDVPPSDERESWLMFVGENATGKSSILQAVGIALLGPRHIAELELDARSFVSHGEDEGVVRVHLPNVSEPVTVTFTKDSPRFISRERRIWRSSIRTFDFRTANTGLPIARKYRNADLTRSPSHSSSS